MKISIITPSYNQGQFIEDNILSVLNQNYNNYEHIIIDACSTDNTVNILKKYSHLKWISEPDKGQSNALNKGFKIASGDIIGWLNADDLYENNAFEIISNYFTKYKNIDLIYGDYYIIDQNNKIIRRMRVPKYDYNTFLITGCYIPTTSSFFKKYIFEKELIDEKYSYCMDFEFYLRLSKKFKFKEIHNCLAKFRYHLDEKSVAFKDLRIKESFDIKYKYSNKLYYEQFIKNKYIYNLINIIYLIKKQQLKYLNI